MSAALFLRRSRRCSDKQVSPSNWFRLQLTTHVTHNEPVISILWDLGTCGFEETQSGNQATFVAYFAPEIPIKEFRRQVKFHLGRLEIEPHKSSVSLLRFSQEESLQKWKEEFTGFPVNETFYIYPSWETAPPNHPIPIAIEPGHAFGSGTHESTQLALSLLTQPSRTAKSILDLGTGSGILLIAASKLSPANTLVGLDIDHQAIDMARHNLSLNDVKGAVLITGTSLSVRSEFDLVLVNLTSTLIRQLVPELSRLTKRYIVLSGFTGEERLEMLEAWEDSPFQITAEKSLNGWLSFLMRREN